MPTVGTACWLCWDTRHVSVDGWTDTWTSQTSWRNIHAPLHFLLHYVVVVRNYLLTPYADGYLFVFGLDRLRCTNINKKHFVTVIYHFCIISIIHFELWNILTLTLLTWRKWWASNNASRWQMGFYLAFKGLITPYERSTYIKTHPPNRVLNNPLNTTI